MAFFEFGINCKFKPLKAQPSRKKLLWMQRMKLKLQLLGNFWWSDLKIMNCNDILNCIPDSLKGPEMQICNYPERRERAFLGSGTFAKWKTRQNENENCDFTFPAARRDDPNQEMLIRQNCTAMSLPDQANGNFRPWKSADRRFWTA